VNLLKNMAPCFKAGKPTEDDELSAEDRKEYTIKMTLQRYYELALQTKKWTVTATMSGNEYKGPEGDKHAWKNRVFAGSSKTEITWRKSGIANDANQEDATKQREIVCCSPGYIKLITDVGNIIDTGGNDDHTDTPETKSNKQGHSTLYIEPGYYDKKTGDVYPHIGLYWSIATSVGGRRDSGPVPTTFKGKISGSVDGIVLPMWCSWSPDWEYDIGWRWSGAISVVATRVAF